MRERLTGAVLLAIAGLATGCSSAVAGPTLGTSTEGRGQPPSSSSSVSPTPPTLSPTAFKFGSNWTVYHANALGTGVDAAGTNLKPLKAAWTSPVLDGQLYGEPLVYDGRVFAATENDTVYELAARTGTVLWHTHVGTAVPHGDVTCGDISPSVGITGTPVVDAARNEIFVVADARAGSTVTHHLVGIAIANGAVELNQTLDPPTSKPPALLQRPGLTLDGGSVIVGFGGNYGDCGTYHGTIASVPASGGATKYYTVDTAPGESQGAVWMGGGAPLVDASGNIWFAVGNGSQRSGTYDDSDSVTELSSSLKLEQLFAPSSWGTDNGTDKDLGSAAPAFAAGFVFQDGKLHVAYLLNPKHLGGVGHQVAKTPLCQQDPHGGLAVVGTTVYLACGEGVTAVQISTKAPYMRRLWTASPTPSGATIDGPPIVAGGLVWSIDAYGTLWGLNPATGAQAIQERTGAGEPNHFPTPSVADGLMLVPTTDQVFAYDGPAGLPPPPPKL